MRSRALITGRRYIANVSTIDNVDALPAGSRIFSLIQPTGKVHIGNYLGAIKNWKDISLKAPEGVKCIFGTADLHSLTAHQSADELRTNRYGAIASLLASGLDPEKCILFHQSSVPEHTELNWVLTCLTTMGALNRMTQWKAKIQAGKQSLFTEQAMGMTKAGLLLYPVLQAADILLYNSTHVPVGEDQVQHLELCRRISAIFNQTYGEFFVAPETILTPTRKVTALRNPHQKMSKSDKMQTSNLYMTDETNDLVQKLRKAVTDSDPGPITYDPIRRPGVANLIRIAGGLTDRTPEEMMPELQTMKNHSELKEYVTEIVLAEFGAKKKLHDELFLNRPYLDQVCARGADQARQIALENLKKVKVLTGLM